ncbi:MAG: hypothetical protein HQK95_02370 [Nitrospirae bacterium]|nr:hypothetical protein [Nitrospirota bacterium]
MPTATEFLDMAIQSRAIVNRPMIHDNEKRYLHVTLLNKHAMFSTH